MAYKILKMCIAIKKYLKKSHIYESDTGYVYNIVYTYSIHAERSLA